MAKKGRRKSSSDTSTMAVKRAYEYLRDKTIDFGFRPGERINEVELANVLDMSRAPVREALNRLVVGGFVGFEPGKGFFCRKFSVTEISELFGVREDLELAAARQTCQIASDEQLATLMTNWQAVVETNLSMSIDELIVSDEQFHIELASLAGNSERIRVLQNINERIRFVRKINIESKQRRIDFVGEHSKIAQAFLSRDEEKAVELMKYHLGLNSKELKANIHEGLARIYAEELV
ncbi:MAG: GntR family transcriptional regulator [Planctomycetaceae bacterium]|nr:GntR family transcriptional regulator [Planctomycetaceae bacterium]